MASEIRESTGRTIWAAAGIFVLALCVRLFYLYENANSPTLNVPIVDARGYDLIARELVETGEMSKQFFWQQFFYPKFLSVVYFFSNCSVVTAQVIHALLGAVNCVLTFFLGRQVFNRRTGIVSAMVVAFYGPLVFHEMDLIAVVWVVFWSLVLVQLFLRLITRRGLLWFFLLGLCSALSIITRPNFMLFIIAGLFWVGFVLYKARRGLFFIAMRFLFVAFGFAVAALPVAFQNQKVTGHFGILPASGGVNLYIGNNPDFEPAEIRFGTMWERIVRMPAKHGVTGDMWQQQKFFYDKTREIFVSDPAGFLKRIANKAIQFVSSREIPGDVDVYLFRQWSKLLRFTMWKVDGFGFPFGLLLPLAVIGLLCNRRSIPMPIVLFVVTYPLLVILTQAKTRYRVPMVPVLAVLAVSGCAYLLRNIMRRNWFRAAGAACLGAAVVFVSTFPGPFKAEKLDYEPELYFGIGRTLQDRGRYTQAQQKYIEAISREPNYVDAHLCLAITLSTTGKPAEAIVHYKKVVELDPNEYRAHGGMGHACYSLGRFEDARRYYTRALEMEPDDAIAHKGLAMTLNRQNKIDEAAAHYKRVLELGLDDVDAHYFLGLYLTRKGDIEGAKTEFGKVLQLNPNHTQAEQQLNTLLSRNRQ